MAQYDYFLTILMIMGLYSFAITLIAHTLPADVIESQMVSDITDYTTGAFSSNSTFTEVQNSLEQQTNLPIIEVGALIYYSGNILIDLMMNFLTAIPQMVGLLIKILQTVLNIDGYIWAQLEIFTTVGMGIFYMLQAISTISNLRSGGKVI